MTINHDSQSNILCQFPVSMTQASIVIYDRRVLTKLATLLSLLVLSHSLSVSLSFNYGPFVLVSFSLSSSFLCTVNIQDSNLRCSTNCVQQSPIKSQVLSLSICLSSVLYLLYTSSFISSLLSFFVVFSFFLCLCPLTFFLSLETLLFHQPNARRNSVGVVDVVHHPTRLGSDRSQKVESIFERGS